MFREKFKSCRQNLNSVTTIQREVIGGITWLRGVMPHRKTQRLSAQVNRSLQTLKYQQTQRILNLKYASYLPHGFPTPPSSTSSFVIQLVRDHHPGFRQTRNCMLSSARHCDSCRVQGLCPLLPIYVSLTQRRSPPRTSGRASSYIWMMDNPQGGLNYLNKN